MRFVPDLAVSGAVEWNRRRHTVSGELRLRGARTRAPAHRLEHPTPRAGLADRHARRPPRAARDSRALTSADMSAGLDVDRLAEGVVVEVRVIEGFTFDQAREPHRHDYHELIWVREGEGEHLIDGESVPVVPDSVTVIGRSRVHQFKRVRNLRGAVLRFQDVAIDGGAGRVGGRWLLACKSARTIPVPDSECDRVAALVHALAAEAARDPDAYTADAQRHLVSTLLLWLERWYDAAQVAEPEGEEADVRLHRRFVELLERDYAAHHDASHYADALAVPPAALSRALASVTGQATKELVTDRVMLEAGRLLRFTDLTIGEIAFQVGFHDPLYFSRAFKRANGSSPQAYRDSVRGKSMHPPGSAIGTGA